MPLKGSARARQPPSAHHGPPRAPYVQIDDSAASAVRLDASNTPVCVTLSKLGRRLIVDASLAEEACASAALSVFVNRAGRVCGMHKHGPSGIDAATMFSAVQAACRATADLFQTLDAALALQHRRREEADGRDAGVPSTFSDSVGFFF